MNECTDVSLHEEGGLLVFGTRLVEAVFIVEWFANRQGRLLRRHSSQAFLGIPSAGVVEAWLGSRGGDLGAWDHEGDMDAANPGRAEQMQSSWARGRSIIGGCN
jgi:hypothetical protein